MREYILKTKSISPSELGFYRDLFFNNGGEGGEDWSIERLLRETGGFIAGGFFKSLSEVEEYVDSYGWESEDMYPYFEEIKEGMHLKDQPGIHMLKDVDIFFESEEDLLNACRVLETNGFEKKYKNDNVIGFEVKVDDEREKIGSFDFFGSFDFMTTGSTPRIELVRRSFNSVKKTLDTFDFNVVKKAVYINEEGEITTIEHKDHDQDLRRRRLQISDNYYDLDLPPEQLFERLYRYHHLYEYTIQDEELRRYLDKMNSTLPREIPFKNFRDFLDDPERFVKVGLMKREDSNEPTDFSYTSRETQKIIFDTLVELSFEERENDDDLERFVNEYIVRSNYETENDYFQEKSSTKYSFWEYDQVSQYKLLKIIEELKKYHDGEITYEYREKVIFVLTQVVRLLHKFEVYHLVEDGLERYGREFIDFFWALNNSEAKVVMPPFRDWVHSMQEDLLDISISPALATSMIFGSSGGEVEEMEAFLI